MVDVNTFSDEALELWKALSKKQRHTIRKDNPLREERDIEICRIRERGAKQTVISEITGMSKTAISKITRCKSEITAVELADVKRDLKELQRITGKLGHHIAEIERFRI